MCNFLTVKDQLAVVTADVDQAQALIDEARSISDDPIYQTQLDEAQIQLDLKRMRIKIMKDIANIVEP
jgi:hypothetical protein